MNDLVKHVPVPREVGDWVRKFDKSKNINDAVEILHIELMGSTQSEVYFKLLDAIDDAQAVEGSMAADNFMACQMIRDLARKKNNPIVKDQKIHTINRALKVVLNRYNLARKQRANMVGGVVVPSENGSTTE